jgi:hypothetical protein
MFLSPWGSRLPQFLLKVVELIAEFDWKTQNWAVRFLQKKWQLAILIPTFKLICLHDLPHRRIIKN